MAIQKTENIFEEGRIVVQGEELSHTEVLKQLDRIATSSFFRHSKRYPSFLRFVVEHTLAGNTDVLKERTLGTEVFARPSEYDTNADPIVRVTAGEIRKRIAQYYQTPGHEHELRIDLPLGSYVPHFLPASLAAQLLEHEGAAHHANSLIPHIVSEEHEILHGEHPATTPAQELIQLAHEAAQSAGRRMRAMLLSVLTLILILGIALFTVNFVRNRAKNQAIRSFWQPIFSPNSPLLIVIGVHSLDSKGDSLPLGTEADTTQNPEQSVLSTMQYSDMVPVSDIVSYSKLTNLITRNSHVYQTKGSAKTSLQDLLHGPVILVGGTDNIWTMRLTSALRYRFFSDGPTKSGIRDSAHPSTVWTVDFLQPALNNSRDYAIVASYLDPTIEQRVLIVAGIGKNGTIAATDFVTVEKYLSGWSKAGLVRNKNIELVLSTEILDGQPGPPHVLASYTW